MYLKPVAGSSYRTKFDESKDSPPIARFHRCWAIRLFDAEILVELSKQSSRIDTGEEVNRRWTNTMKEENIEMTESEDFLGLAGRRKRCLITMDAEDIYRPNTGTNEKINEKIPGEITIFYERFFLWIFNRNLSDSICILSLSTANSDSIVVHCSCRAKKENKQLFYLNPNDKISTEFSQSFWMNRNEIQIRIFIAIDWIDHWLRAEWFNSGERGDLTLSHVSSFYLSIWFSDQRTISQEEHLH